MRTLGVVTVDPATNSLSGLASCFECVEINAFVFERPPEPLDHHVVHPASLAVHRDLDAGIPEGAGEGVIGKLAALIGIENLGLPIMLQGLFQGRNTEIGILGVGQPLV